MRHALLAGASLANDVLVKPCLDADVNLRHSESCNDGGLTTSSARDIHSLCDWREDTCVNEA